MEERNTGEILGRKEGKKPHKIWCQDVDRAVILGVMSWVKDTGTLSRCVVMRVNTFQEEFSILIFKMCFGENVGLGCKFRSHLQTQVL